MIGASSSGVGFRALGHYLTEKDPSRVEWAEARNTVFERPREVVAEMEEWAAQNGRVEKPMYHVAITFDPDDRPTDAEVRGAVDRTLRDLGLEQHQALVVRHNDTDHAHVHVMVNRVGPDGKAWSRANDRYRLRVSMEAQERELGVRWTGRNAEREAVAERAPGRAAAQAPRRDRGFAAEVRLRALGDLREAANWDDLRARLGSHGYRIEGRGQGAVVTDGEREAKLSAVSRAVSRGRLEARLGPLRSAAERAVGRQRADGAQIAGRDLRAAREGQTGIPGRPRAGRAAGGLAARLATPRRAALRRVRGLRGAARAFGSVRERDGGQERAVARFGVRAGVRAGRLLARSLAVRRAAAGASQPSPRTLDGPTRGGGRRLTAGRLAGLRQARSAARVERAVGLVGEVRRWERLDRALHGAAAARGRVGRATQLARTAGERARELDRALGGVYADPQAARTQALRYADAAGPERAARVLAESPEKFGPLAQGAGGPASGLRALVGRSSGRAPAESVRDRARAAAPALAGAAQARAEATAAIRALGSDVGGGDLREAVRRRESRLQAAAAWVGGPGRAERALARAVGRLSPGERVRVAERVGAAGVSVAARAVEAVRAVARGIER